jgi:hypothetical protein
MAAMTVSTSSLDAIISRASDDWRTVVFSPFALIFSASRRAWGALAITAKRGLN